jgi:hypothetical protein
MPYSKFLKFCKQRGNPRTGFVQHRSTCCSWRTSRVIQASINLCFLFPFDFRLVSLTFCNCYGFYGILQIESFVNFTLRFHCLLSVFVLRMLEDASWFRRTKGNFYSSYRWWMMIMHKLTFSDWRVKCGDRNVKGNELPYLPLLSVSKFVTSCITSWKQ